MTLPTPEQERKMLAMLFVCVGLAVVGVMSLLVLASLALTGIARLVAGWVFG